MARRRDSKPGRTRPRSGSAAFGSGGQPAGDKARGTAPVLRQQVIPPVVANRMGRRIAIATGIPSLLGMAVFVTSYLLVSRSILAIPPVATLLASGGCFLLGLLGLSYGVLSSSWEESPGTVLGIEQLRTNLGRLRESLRAMRQGRSGSPQG